MEKEKNEFWEWLKIIITAVVVTAFIRHFLFTPIIVDGESMLPTLEDRDRMIVNKFAYRIGKPERFDIIVFKAEENKDYIKRIIGLPGEHIEYKDDVLYINGIPYEEPFLEKQKALYGGTTFTQPFADYVPEGHVYVLGDNRPHSKDSRHIGPIPIEDIMGKATLIFWPPSDFQFIH